MPPCNTIKDNDGSGNLDKVLGSTRNMPKDGFLKHFCQIFGIKSFKILQNLQEDPTCLDLRSSSKYAKNLVKKLKKTLLQLTHFIVYLQNPKTRFLVLDPSLIIVHFCWLTSYNRWFFLCSVSELNSTTVIKHYVLC